MLEFINALITAFGLIFLAELGDKTQIVILACAARGYSAKKIALGASTGFAIIVVFGGLISTLITRYVDLRWIKIFSAAVFIVLGIIQVVGLLKTRQKAIDIQNHADEDICKPEDLTERKSAFVTGLVAILGMEMGDKTQIMTIMLASSLDSIPAVLLGSWLALSLVAIIGAFSGKWLSKKMPQHVIDWIAAVLFIVLGAIILAIELG